MCCWFRFERGAGGGSEHNGSEFRFWNFDHVFAWPLRMVCRSNHSHMRQGGPLHCFFGRGGVANINFIYSFLNDIGCKHTVHAWYTHFRSQFKIPPHVLTIVFLIKLSIQKKNYLTLNTQPSPQKSNGLGLRMKVQVYLHIVDFCDSFYYRIYGQRKQSSKYIQDNIL